MHAVDHQIIDHIAAPVFVVNVLTGNRFTFRACNSAFLALADHKVGEIINQTPHDIFPARVGKGLQDRFLRATVQRRQETSIIEIPFPSGVRSLQVTLTPVQEVDGCGDTDNGISALVGTVNDVTAVKQDQLVRVQSEADSHLLSEEMEQFVAFAAHDLRAPMRQISILSQLVREDFQDLGDGKAELLTLLESVAVKATGLISNILDYAQASHAHSGPVQFDLDAVINDILAVLDPHANVKFDHCHDTVTTDRVALQIILHNLIDNALKHAGAHQLCLQMDVNPVEEGWLAFTVTDNGVGFPDPNAALNDDGKFHARTHFGLKGIRRLVMARGGQISIANSATGGSIVQFTFPGIKAGDTTLAAALQLQNKLQSSESVTPKRSARS